MRELTRITICRSDKCRENVCRRSFAPICVMRSVDGIYSDGLGYTGGHGSCEDAEEIGS
ncbi:hypothetical protein L208DRAFT_1391176 [Tricholoma matsutake]|nr:hypothetical protein L208DRAFT_1391176 [Tricholoma matsutake 945]